MFDRADTGKSCPSTQNGRLWGCFKCSCLTHRCSRCSYCPLLSALHAWLQDDLHSKHPSHVWVVSNYCHNGLHGGVVGRDEIDEERSEPRIHGLCIASFTSAMDPQPNQAYAQNIPASVATTLNIRDAQQTPTLPAGFPSPRPRTQHKKRKKSAENGANLFQSGEARYETMAVRFAS